MDIQTFQTWNNQRTVTAGRTGADAKRYVGVAIGPESDDSLVRVGGTVLGAGRVLPLVGQTYTIEKMVAPGLAASQYAVGAYASIAKLQVVLFEDKDEMSGFKMTARPMKTYSSGAVVVNNSVQAPVFFPFRGRTNAMLRFWGSDPGNHNVLIFGVRYNASNAAQNAQSDGVYPAWQNYLLESQNPATWQGSPDTGYTYVLGANGVNAGMTAQTAYMLPYDAIFCGMVGPLVGNTFATLDVDVWGEI